MPNLTGDSSGINLNDPISLSIPADGQPAAVESALGIRAVLQRITNFIKALVVRGDSHATRLSDVEAKLNPVGNNAFWHSGNLKIYKHVLQFTFTTSGHQTGVVTVFGVLPGDTVVLNYIGNNMYGWNASVLTPDTVDYDISNFGGLSGAILTVYITVFQF
jgi:hypothetical protein